MAFDAGAVKGKITLDHTQWDQAINHVKQTQQSLVQPAKQAGESMRQEVEKTTTVTEREWNETRIVVNRTQEQMGRDVHRVNRKMTDDVEKGQQRIRQATQQTTHSFANLKNAMLGLGAGIAIRSLGQAQLQFERIDATLQASAGSAAGAREEWQFLRTEADRLGLQLSSTALAYSRLSAAAKGTELEGQATREIFLSVAQAATAMGLSISDTEGILRALEQMISKGNVQAEELRGQLGERLPGAFQLAAKAMGVTTQELNKMLDNGEVLASDLLPRLAKELNNAYGAQASMMTNKLQANLNRLQNQFTEIRKEIALAFSDEAVAALKFMSEHMHELAIAAGLFVSYRVAGVMGQLATSAAAAATSGKLLSASLAGIGGPAGLATLAGSALLAYSKSVKDAAKAEQDLQDELDLTYNRMMRNINQIDPVTGERMAPTQTRAAFAADIAAVEEELRRKQEELARLTALRPAGGWPYIPRSVGSPDEIERVRREIEELTARIRLLNNEMERAPESISSLSSDALARIEGDFSRVEKFFDSIRQQNEELQLVLSGQEDRIDMLRAERELRELIQQIGEKQGLSEEVMNESFERRQGILAELMGDYQRLSEEVRAQTEAQREAERAQQEMQQRQQRMAEQRAEFIGGYDDEIQKLQMVLNGEQERIAIFEAQRRLQKIMNGEASQADLDRVAALEQTLQDMQEQIKLQEEQARFAQEMIDADIERGLALREMSESLDAEIAAAQNRLNLSDRQAQIENQMLDIRRRFSDLSDEQEAGYRRQLEQLQAINDAYVNQQRELQRSKEIADSYAYAIGRGFEDAVFQGGNFKDVLADISEQILRITFRVMVLEPLMEKLSAAMRGGGQGGGGGSSPLGMIGSLLGAVGGFFVGGPAGAAAGVSVGGAAGTAGGGSGVATKMAARGAIITKPTLLANDVLAGEQYGNGEVVLPLRRTPSGDLGVRAIEGGDGGRTIQLTILNQITPEAIAAAMSGPEGQGVIVNTINMDALNNGKVRRTIRGI